MIENNNVVHNATYSYIFFLLSPVMGNFFSCDFEVLFDKLISDSRSVRAESCSEIFDLLNETNFDEWNANQTAKKRFEQALAPRIDEICELLGSSDSDIVFCALEILARANTISRDKSTIVEDVLGDYGGNLGNRIQAARALCNMVPPNESVFSKIDDVGSTFGLWAVQYALATDQNANNLELAFKYQGLFQSAYYLYDSAIRPTKRENVEAVSIGTKLRTEKVKIVKIYLLILLSLMKEKAVESLEVVEAGMSDADREICYFSTYAAIMIRGQNPKNVDDILRLSKLDADDKTKLKEVFDSPK